MWNSTQPEQRAARQEVANLVAAVVEDQRVPVAMFAEARIGVFVQRGAVESREAVCVARKMRGHPVEQHADTALVQVIDEPAKVVGRAEAARRREVAQRLIAPRAVERMFGDRHQFDVSESQRLRVVGESRRQRSIVEKVAVVGALPRAQMNLVDRNRRLRAGCCRVACASHAASSQRCDEGAVTTDAVSGRMLELARVWIGLQSNGAAVAIADFEFVAGAGAISGMNKHQMPL